MSDIKQHFDLVIIALDASLRGLNCLLVEQNDFSEGTCKPPQKLNHLKQNNSDKINQESSCERVNSQTSKLSRF